jgi:branched-chain amino acid transport system ATP-binding protein
VYERDQGRIELSGEDVTGLTPDKLAARGLSRTFQNLQIFQRMTAAENVMVGRHLRERRNLLADMFRLPSVTRQNSETREAALALLDGVGRKAARMFPRARCPMGPANASNRPCAGGGTARVAAR